MIYFIQTLPSPTEGPHAQEVTAAQFLQATKDQPTASIEIDLLDEEMHLRLDLPLDTSGWASRTVNFGGTR